jgi:polysaccharide biosynthesis/export protein ExoF
LPAAGQSTSSLADEVAVRLQDKAGLTDKPSVVIDIAEFRPYYMLGNVERQGEYPFRAGMTALKALSLAGGLRQSADSSSWQLSRDLLAFRGELLTVDQTIASLLVRQKRLEAELTDQDHITQPAELPVADGLVSDLMDIETKLHSHHRDTTAAKHNFFVNQKAMNEAEIEVLQQSADATKQQLDLTREEIKRSGALLKSGLTTTTRAVAIENSGTTLQTQQLDIATRIVMVREQIAAIERDQIEYDANRKEQLLADSRDTAEKLREARQRKATLTTLIAQAEAASNIVPAAATGVSPIIIRRDEREIRVSLNEDVALQPGDLITIGEAFDAPANTKTLNLSSASSPTGIENSN